MELGNIQERLNISTYYLAMFLLLVNICDSDGDLNVYLDF